MAAGTSSAPAINGTHSNALKPIELAISLPHGPGTRIHVHLTILSTTLSLFLTSASLDGTHGPSSMGSFVYALPDRYNPTQPLSTPLYTIPSTLDFTTRLAKLLVRRTRRAVYVGNSINLSGAVGGGTVEEEMEVFKAILEIVLGEVEKREQT